MQTIKIFDKALTYEEKDYTLCHINDSPIIILTTNLQKPMKLTTSDRFKLTTLNRLKLTSANRLKLTT